MFIEKLFGNTFGLVWLIVFMVAVLALIVWMFVKKENKTVENKVVEEDVTNSMEILSDTVVSETSETVNEEVSSVADVEEVVVETKEEKFETVAAEPVVNVDNDYEIVCSEDGFFRVKKVGNDRTLRKFSTRI